MSLQDTYNGLTLAASAETAVDSYPLSIKAAPASRLRVGGGAQTPLACCLRTQIQIRATVPSPLDAQRLASSCCTTSC